MKKLFSLGIIALGLVLSGCASKDSSLDGVQDVTCTFPDSPSDKAPSWVCDVMPKDLALGAQGYAKKNIAGFSIMKKIAVNNARVALANAFQTDVTNMFRQALKSTSTSTTADGTQEQAVQTFENVTKNVTNQTLTNSRIIVSQFSPAGGLYVLVGMDKATYDENVQRVVDEAKDKDSKLRKQFSNDKAEKALVEALNSMLK